MDHKVITPNTQSHPTDFHRIAEWLAEAGIAVALVDNEPDECSVCQPNELHVAA